ncbi:hypothetical protein ACQY0O_000423 [Thecaphora frezii]
MSALAHVASPTTQNYAQTLPNGERTLRLPDGRPLGVNIIVFSPAPARVHGFDIQGGDLEADLISLKTAYISTKPKRSYNGHDDDGTDEDEEEDDFENEYADFGRSVFELAPPCAPYPNPLSEPDDNTLATRSKRFAYTQIHKGSSLGAKALWNWFYIFFQLWPGQEWFTLRNLDLDEAAMRDFVDRGLAIVHPLYRSETGRDLEYLLISRAAFWQGAAAPVPLSPWVLPQATASARTALLSSNAALNLSAPVKPKAKDGVLYSRYIPELQQTLSFRVASSDKAEDVDLLTKWHDSERVHEGWRQRGTREEQLAHVKAMEADPYSLGLIGEWDGEAWGYVEVYYAKHNNLRSYYNASTRDRGFHALVGNEKFRGPHRVRCWMSSVVHLLFLMDPQTQLVVSEPRLSNTKMVNYECMCGGHVEKSIDLPHKRAALVFFPRERFFQLCPLQPLPEHLGPRLDK